VDARNKALANALVRPFDDTPDTSEAAREMAARLVSRDQAASQAWRSGMAEALSESWPAELAKSAYGAVTLPGDVYAGKVNPTSDEAVGRAFELAGLVTGGAGAMPAGRNEMRMGMSRPPKDAPEQLFDYSQLSKVPNVPQFDLPRNIPARGVPERVQDVINDRGVRDKMLATIQEGVEKGGANWYNAEPLRLEFVREMGENSGNAAFRKYMDYVAATSPRSDVGSNVRNASYYYGRDMRGEGMPAVGDRNPQPYGHMAQRLHQMNAERVQGAGWDALNNPKPASFVENLVGNQTPATIDTHAFRLPAIHAQDPRFLETAFQVSKDAPKENIQALVKSGAMPMSDVRPAHWQAQPKANEYAAMENYYQGLGKEMGLTPAQTQASAWVGGGKLTGLASDESKPFMRFFEDRVHKTAQAYEMDPRKVLSDFIKGKMGLLSVAGAAGTGAALTGEQILDWGKKNKVNVY
jgi:hypothetical protein